MSYLCPFCHHQQKKRTLCNKCNFDLSANMLNPFCSKCNVRFPSMHILKVHFKTCEESFDNILALVNHETNDSDSSNESAKCEQDEVTIKRESEDFNNTLVPTKTCTLCFEILSSFVCLKCGYSLDTPLQCPVCKYTYSSACNLRSHYRNKCLVRENDSNDTYKRRKLSRQVYQCSKCKITFSSRFNRNKHVLRNACGRENYAKCYYEGCTVRCMRRSGLLKHLKESHGVELLYAYQKFPTFKDFELWRDQYGMETLTFFTIMSKHKHPITSKMNRDHIVKTLIYACSFDFQRAGSKMEQYRKEDRALVKRKVRFDLNSNNVCTARIVLKIFSNGEVIGKLCTTHTHAIALENITVQKLPQSRRDFLRDAFLLGADVNQVMEVIKQEVKDVNIVTKETSLPRRFFKEIQRKTLLKYTESNDMLAVDQCVQDLKLSDSLLIYKHDSKSFGLLEGLPDDTFVLGWQTPDMFHLFKTYSSTVHVDGLYNLLHYPNYRLYNFLVTDENKTVFPVAHFITNQTDAVHLTQIFSSLKSRTADLQINRLVLQNDNELEKAVRNVFQCKTVSLNDWDLQVFDQQRKLNKVSESEDMLRKQQDSSGVEDSQEETVLGYETSFPFAESDETIVSFHREIRAQLKHSHRIFFVLNVLSSYLKKKLIINYKLLEDRTIPGLLVEMRKKLLDFKYETLKDSEISRVKHLFQEDDIVDTNIMGCEDITPVLKIKAEIVEPKAEENESVDNGEDIQSASAEDDEMTETDEEGNISSGDSDTNRNETEKNQTYENIADDEEILKEILASEDVIDDSHSVYLLKELHNAIITMLENNDIARPLIIKNVLDSTQAIYDQVQECCNKTQKLITR